jgi:hypothetical protein
VWRAVSKLPLQKNTRIAHAVDAGVLRKPARLMEEVVVPGQEFVVRRWSWQQPGLVLLVKHSEQMTERGLAYRARTREAT